MFHHTYHVLALQLYGMECDQLSIYAFSLPEVAGTFPFLLSLTFGYVWGWYLRKFGSKLRLLKFPVESCIASSSSSPTSHLAFLKDWDGLSGSIIGPSSFWTNLILIDEANIKWIFIIRLDFCFFPSLLLWPLIENVYYNEHKSFLQATIREKILHEVLCKRIGITIF